MLVIVPINLSILDFKESQYHNMKEEQDPINLSILDFKVSGIGTYSIALYPINLSILDFKLFYSAPITFRDINYKSIHIGF